VPSKFARFLKLERPHQPAVHKPPERPRFEEPKPALEEPSDAQPFRRCASCEMDNTRFAERCTNCKAALHTAEQEAFNARLWEARQLQAAEEQVAAAASTAMTSADQRKLGEAIAQLVAKRERGRLGFLDFLGASAWTPLGLRVYSSLPSDRARAAFLSACAFLCLGGFWLSLREPSGSGLHLLGFAAGVGMVALFVPGSSKPRW